MSGIPRPIADEDDSGPSPSAFLASRGFVAVLVVSAVVGVVASLVAWLFLELLHGAQRWVFTDLPETLGLGGTPLWWYLPVMALAGMLAALAIERLPGDGGHSPAHGLDPSPTRPAMLPGVALAALASIAGGFVLGPEAPLIAVGGGLGYLAVHLLRRDAPAELGTLIAAAGTFAAISFLFGSPLIAAVLLVEAAAPGKDRLPLLLLPGLLAAGIGSLVSLGMGSWTGVDRSDISFTLLDLPGFDRPDLVDFLWTIPLAAVVALGAVAIFRVAQRAEPAVSRRRLVALPAIGLVVAGLAIAFSELTDKGVEQVLYSGQTTIGPLVSDEASWSLSALALVIGLKGFAYALSLSGFRGGPVFPALFLGAAAGVMAAHLPGFELTAAVSVCLGAAVTAVLRLPLSGVVLATLLTSSAGLGATPLIILAVVVAYLVALAVALPAPEERPAAVQAA